MVCLLVQHFRILDDELFIFLSDSRQGKYRIRRRYNRRMCSFVLVGCRATLAAENAKCHS
jgi:hypothetical protein